ncbi:hypothetical protein H0194_07820 [Corynebacterium incognita]|uniref:Uncharacterized protein n=1 Tax=Corynebacterium incognita TaxID=2754725 RepID=A0A7G7CN18_9CORY|nr:hypothetical protein [Corynebacterium incognita]QNE88984.1 hypothetical protein H0194_07820 [Corynebacterium incognita]
MNQTGVRSEVAALRARMSAKGVTPVERVLPARGLARRQVTAFNDCPPLVVDTISQLTARDKTVGVVAWPGLLLGDVPDLGNIITVPEPGAEALSVTGVLLEGLDVVFHYSPVPVALTPTRARPLLARLRAGRAALVTIGLDVPGTRVRVTGQVRGVAGIGWGVGRVRDLDLDVQVESRRRLVAV